MHSHTFSALNRLEMVGPADGSAGLRMRERGFLWKACLTAFTASRTKFDPGFVRAVVLWARIACEKPSYLD